MKRRRRLLLLLLMLVLIGENLYNVDVPKNPILSRRSMRNIVSDGVSPRRQATVTAKEVAITSLELDQSAVPDRLPGERRVETARIGLEDFSSGGYEEKRFVRRRQVFAVSASEADEIVGARDRLHGPLGRAC